MCPDTPNIDAPSCHKGMLAFPWDLVCVPCGMQSGLLRVYGSGRKCKSHTWGRGGGEE